MRNPEDRMSGFKLAPSRLNRPTATEVAAPARTNFTGLTASKLGLLAESKLTPSSGAIQAKSSNGDTKDKVSSKDEAESLATPITYSFTPLSRPVNKPDDCGDIPNEDSKEKGEGETKTNSFSVFGENLSEKVTALPTTNNDTTNENQIEAKSNNTDSEEVNNKEFHASSMLFQSAATKSSDDESEKKTLSESAAEYTESHSNKRKYDVVDVVTGEESESNVMQAQVKLYIFDKEKRNWTERGRGVLRLNDDPVSTPGHLKSRLVMRTSGNMRVVLNTKLWADMICEKANEKSVRISALDEGEVKIFLISCSIKEAEKLYTALEYRINELKINKGDGEEEEEESGEPPEKKVAPDTND